MGRFIVFIFLYFDGDYIWKLMYCFIGGSGSTGSSLLANILNRHSKVLCGPETYLFTKHQLFEDWTHSKENLLHGKLKSFPWHRYSRVDLSHEYYQWEEGKLLGLLKYAKDIKEFSDEFFSHTRRQYNKTHWIEKTPSNVYNFHLLPEYFPGCYLIHTVRNPYDAILSLNKRGFNIYYATALYLLNTAVGMAMRHYDNYIELIYEDFVNDPEKELRRICTKLGIRFEKEMLSKAKEQIDEDISSWGASESGEVLKNHTGKFNAESWLVQHEIIYTVNSLAVSRYYKEKYNLEFVRIPEICEYYGFKHYEDEGLYNIFQLQIDKSRDHILRCIKGYPGRGKRYPVGIYKM